MYLHEPLKKRSAPKAFEGAVLPITMADVPALRQGLGEVCLGASKSEAFQYSVT